MDVNRDPQTGLPEAPPAHAGAEAWRAYAQELARIVAASERRADFLHERLNTVVSSAAWKMLRQARKLLPSTSTVPADIPRQSLAPATHAVHGQPLVSILIPFRDGARYLTRCLSSLREKTAYHAYEIILIDNGSREKATQRLLDKERGFAGTQILRVDERFNFSRLNNLGAKAARGEHLLFLNSDTEILHPEWLAALLALSQNQEVGVVGAKLLYADGRIQHAGISLRLDDIAGHEFRLWPADAVAVQTVRTCPAVTAACMMSRAAVFAQLGGFDELHLPVAYGDVDYCLRAADLGLQTLYTPYAELTHHESVARGTVNDPRESAYMCRRWGAKLAPQ